jgi:type IV pilus assembly protein PilV
MTNSPSNTCTQSHNSFHKLAGFTMVEVLIALLVLAIGILGMAGIQIQGMRGTQSSFLSTEATNIAQDMAERMLANPVAAQNSGGTERDGTPLVDNQFAAVNSAAYVCNDTDNPVTECRGIGANCTPTEMARYDIETWICGMPNADGGVTPGISARLDNGIATIQCIDNDAAAAAPDADPCSPGSTHRITVSWDETSPSDGTIVNRTAVVFTVP